MKKKNGNNATGSKAIFVSREALEEILRITEGIWALKADRILTFTFMDGEDLTPPCRMYLPQSSAAEMYRGLFSDIALMIVGGGSLVVRVLYPDKTEVFGLFGYGDGWVELSPDEMMEASTTCSGCGEMMEPEEGVTYTTFSDATRSEFMD